MINKDWGGGTISIFWGRHSCYGGGTAVMEGHIADWGSLTRENPAEGRKTLADLSVCHRF